jgi:hypothetical protein
MIKESETGFIQTYIDAFMHVFTNRGIFMEAITDCEATGPEFLEGIKKLAPLTDISAASSAITMATLHSPWTFPMNLVRAKSAFSDGNFVECGRALGENLKLILLEMPKDNLKIVSELEQFLDAFWKSAFGIPLHLNGCTSNSEESYEVIAAAMAIINNPTDPVIIARSVAYIVQHYDSFTKAFDGCVDSAAALAEGFVELTAFGGVEGFTSAMTAAMKAHPLGFMLNVKKAQSAISEGRYADAGKYIGQDLAWMLE